MKEFNPRITNIKHIGDELRFQRYYYCYKNNRDIRLKSETLENSSPFEKLENVLLKYINENFGDISENGASYDNLYSIENNRSRKKNSSYNPNIYYLRMYSLFKIYGFLDDYEICNLLEENNIEPNFKDSKLIARDIIRNSEEEYQYNNRKRYFDISSCRVPLNAFSTFTISQAKDLIYFSNENYLKKSFDLGKLSISVFFSKFKPLFNKTLSSLSKLERKTFSLELGKNSSYIDNYLNNKPCTFPTCGTIIKFLEKYDLTKSDLYIALSMIKPALAPTDIYRDMIPHTHFRKLNKNFG